jgi:hypothetical protein
LVLLCSRHHHRVHAHSETLVLHPDGQLDVTGLTGILRSSNPPPDIGQLFKPPQRRNSCSAAKSKAGERRIKRVLNALQDHDSLINRIFSDQPHRPAQLFVDRHNPRRHKPNNLETHTYTYETINDIGTLIKT